MNTFPSLTITALMLLIWCGISGCMPAVRLDAPQLEKAPTRIGSVALGEIRDLRPQDAGGGDFGIIGEVRRGFGGFSPLRTSEGREINLAIRKALQNTLEHAGYYLLTPALPGDVPLLEVEVMNFWFESRHGYRIDTLLVLTLVDPGNRASLARQEISVIRDLTGPAGQRSLSESFDRVMRDLQQEFAAFMQSESFRISVRAKPVRSAPEYQPQ